jgi:hypothetical protein
MPWIRIKYHPSRLGTVDLTTMREHLQPFHVYSLSAPGIASASRAKTKNNYKNEEEGYLNG